MVSKLPHTTMLDKDVVQDESEENKQQKSLKKKAKKHIARKSPGKITKPYVIPSDLKTHSSVSKSKPITICINTENDSSVLRTQSINGSTATPVATETSTAKKTNEQTTRVHDSKYDDKNSGRTIQIPNATSPVIDQIPRYKPEDYVHQSSDSATTSNGDSSNLFSDDSSYFSDNGEQFKHTRTSKHVKCPGSSKVQLYDHSKHHSKTYEKPVDAVEKIHTWNEPSATDVAQEIRQRQTTETHLAESRKSNAHKRGEDAVLREKVRRDYQTLLQNLDYLVGDERKLKASQVERYPRDIHVQEERRKILKDQHQKKLNRAVQTLINEECLEQCLTYPMERQITITPREANENQDIRVVWDASCPNEEHTETNNNVQKDKENEISREEQILNMLKKVERQRQLLLKEFGADLPNDIFNATTKPLFERERSVQRQSITSQDVHIQKPLSPEIRVISTSHEETSKRSQIEEKDSSSIEKVEIAIQTATEKDHAAQDKSIQVELVQEKEKSSSVTNGAETTEKQKHYPIEPKITVITPQADSSESASSTVTNTVTDTEKQDVKIASKKKKRTMKTLKQVPSKKFQKSSSLRVNKTPSFTKKCPKTLSKSRYNKYQKISGAVIDGPSKRIKIYVNESGFNIKVSPPQTADVAVDVSTQNSRVYSTSIQEQPTNKLHMQSQSKQIKVKDISDSSTSFASPPPIKPKNLFEVLSNNISILEMLDSSANESIKRLRRDVSPVSTPETPSPRTMRMPSNIPHPAKISRMLRYASTDTQINDNSILSSTKSGYSPSTDLSDYQQPEHILAESTARSSKQLLNVCSCKNPECKLMHTKLDSIHGYALKNCPEMLQKYQDLQTMCAERIVSLTNLIEKVRNEQKGMELSGFSAGDETSLMQLPPPRPRTNDLQSVRQLVENIEAIHNQLAKTLIESQKIIKNNVVVEEEGTQTKEAITSNNKNESKNGTHYTDSKTKALNIKTKPQIINEERVNIQLDRFKIPQTMSVTQESSSWVFSKFHDEEVIEKLSKEILEQSKSFNNNVMSTKETDNSEINQTTQTSADINDIKDSPLRTQKTEMAIKKQSNKELKSTKDFVPLLADIPKISRTIENAMLLNGRSKPPVSLLSGPYRAEIESSGHELSTIIEFDTPDTLNKSQNIRSPAAIKKTAETQITKSAIIVKPSEPVTSSPNIQDKNYSPTSKFSAMVSTQKIEETTSFDLSKDAKGRNIVINKNEKKKCIRETNSKKLQSLPIEQFYPISPASTDPNKQDKSNRDKITSTSSNSFSGLSGISQIASTPSSDILKYASSPEEMEIALKKLGLGWAITTLKKTREASALSSSSNSDERTPIGTAKRIISPSRKQFDSNYGLPDFSDVSSISIKEASKSTEQAVLLKGRTSTPKLQHSNSNSGRVNSSNTNVSENYQEPSDALIIPNISLNKAKANKKKTENQ
ncbi:uncharacterized protein LOC143180326 isoform X2 [Calliopsis andreniformis]